MSFENLTFIHITIPPCVPCMGHCCVIHALNLRVYVRGDCWWRLVFSDCIKQARCYHYTHRKKKKAHFHNPEKSELNSKGFLSNSWYLRKGALEAGKQSSRPRQLWASQRPHASVYHLYCKEAQRLLNEITQQHSVGTQHIFQLGNFLSAV